MADRQSYLVWGVGRAAEHLIASAPNARQLPPEARETASLRDGWCREVRATRGEIADATRYCEAVRGLMEITHPGA